MRKGFTLIELLVVLLIIGIVAALLMPAFGKAKQAALQTQCRNNGRQIAIAFSTYMGDHKDRLPYYNNMADCLWEDAVWEGDRIVSGTIVDRRESIDVLVPSYLSDVRLLHCPSDKNSPDILIGFNWREATIGLDVDYWVDEGFKRANWFTNDYYWAVCDPRNDPRSNACKYVGLQRADHQSYVYTGEESIQQDEFREPARMRIFADNEEEGDEQPNAYRGRGGNPLYNEFYCGERCEGNCPTGLIHYVNWKPFGDIEFYREWAGLDLGVAYYYVGGLEPADNHGQDGVNVLYLDWHLEFDGRDWPSPIGWLETNRFPHQYWTDEAKAGCEISTYLREVPSGEETETTSPQP